MRAGTTNTNTHTLGSVAALVGLGFSQDRAIDALDLTGHLI
jgi:hypothetical protein